MGRARRGEAAGRVEERDDQVRSLIQDPEYWMKRLSEKTCGKPDCITLATPFTMEIRLLPKKWTRHDPDRFFVQGIDKTSLITIRPVPTNRDHGFTDHWNGYWDKWASDPITLSADSDLANGVPLHVVHKGRVGYGHMELSEDADCEPLRADKVAAFLIRSATGYREPKGRGDCLAINRLLGKKCQEPLASVREGFESFVPGRRAFKNLTLPELRHVGFTYIGTFGAKEVCRACDNKAGEIKSINGEPMIVLDQVAVKCYK